MSSHKNFGLSYNFEQHKHKSVIKTKLHMNKEEKNNKVRNVCNKKKITSQSCNNLPESCVCIQKHT